LGASIASSNSQALNSQEAQSGFGRMLASNNKDARLSGPVVSPVRGFARNEPGALAGESRDLASANKPAERFAYFGVDKNALVQIYSNTALVGQPKSRADTLATTAPKAQLPQDGAVSFAQPLSSTFQVQEANGRIEIRDSDGSLYIGQISLPAQDVVQAKEEADRLSESKSKLRTTFLEPFVATGTNLTLNKLVVVRANFLPDSPETASVRAQVQNGPSKQAGTELSFQRRIAGQVEVSPEPRAVARGWRGRIDGNAQIAGQTNILRIDATQVSP
jgi:hypothetical protein